MAFQDLSPKVLSGGAKRVNSPKHFSFYSGGSLVFSLTRFPLRKDEALRNQGAINEREPKIVLQLVKTLAENRNIQDALVRQETIKGIQI